MKAQLINFSRPESFHFYQDKYKISSNNFPGMFGLELRDISSNIVKKIGQTSLEDFFCNNNNILFIGSINNIEIITAKINEDEISSITERTTNNYKNYDKIVYKINEKEFLFNRSYIMGILNVTPDSFSDGGIYSNVDDAVNHAINMLNLGADIIDIGGESTRPGAEKVSFNEELKRVIPVLEKILEQKPNAIISIDTTKSKVAEESLKKGAKIINDISGLTFDPEIVEVVKHYNASLVIMHIKGTPQDMQNNPYYENVIEEIYDFLYEQSEKANKLEIKNIFIDPGIGFGKRVEDNLNIIKKIDDFKSLGYPILIGVSRKAFIGKTLNRSLKESDTATALVETVAIKNGAKIIRTHNIQLGAQVIKLINNLN